MQYAHPSESDLRRQSEDELENLKDYLDDDRFLDEYQVSGSSPITFVFLSLIISESY